MRRRATKCDADGDGQDKLGQRRGDQYQPTDTLGVICALPWLAGPEPVTTQDWQFSPERSCAPAGVKYPIRIEPRLKLLPQGVG